MRVLHVTPYFAPAFGFGGPPRSILALCHAQQQAGIDVEVFTTTAHGSEPLPAAPGGTTYEGVPVRYFPVRGWRPLFWAPALTAALTHAAKTADAVHAHGLFNAPTWQAHRVAVAAQRPLVVSVRGMLEPKARMHHALRKRAAWTLFDRRVCDDTALFHTTSAAETANVTAAVTDAKIAEIANHVEIGTTLRDSDRHALRTRLGVDANTPLVVFLGRLHPIKRLDLLARAFASVASRHGRAVLVIAGDGEGTVRADTEVMLGAAASRTIWLGRVDGAEREALLAEATVFVLCSDSENFGMGVAEALHFGVVPVVTHTCPWDVLESERAGMWVPQTADAVAAGIEHILANPLEARGMGERGRRLSALRFSAHTVGNAWRNAYAQLTAA